MIKNDPRLENLISYWNRKILLWEKKRYFSQSLFNAPLQFRQQSLFEKIHSKTEGRVILELGCGSGIFYEKIKSLPFKQYIGLDFSSTAINEFQKKLDHAPDSRVKLYQQPASQRIQDDVDLVISTGLLDWLSDNDLKALAESYSDKDFIHSYSSSQVMTIRRWFHQIYCHCLCFLFKKYCIPRYYTDRDVLALFSHSQKEVKIESDPRMLFGKFISNIKQ